MPLILNSRAETRPAESPGFALSAGAQRQITAGWPILIRQYLFWAGIFFFLYASFGKGFAYLGVAPVYAGELLLLFSGVVIIRCGSNIKLLLTSPLGWLLGCFFAWELARTLPLLGIFGLDTVRDAVIWLYALFAVCMALVVSRHAGAIAMGVQVYRRFGSAFLIVGTICAILYAGIPTHLPTWPGTDVTIPNTKCTDLCIHLAGAISFLLVGLAGEKRWWLAPALVAFAVGFALSRGGGLSFLLSSALILLLYPEAKRLFLIGSGVVVIVLLAFCIDVRFKMGDREREVSTQQLVRNFGSLLGEKSVESDLDDTKQWRMDWWQRIIGYTVHGPYFWTGKGFGVNLTLDDGMERRETDFLGLRSPHNSHLTFLARSGVPGFVLWFAVQTYWCAMLAFSHYRARVAGERTWAALFAWLIAYWLAFMVNAAFDVAFEGPVTGIPFWMVWGFGWGAALVFGRLQKQAFDRWTPCVFTPTNRKLVIA